MNETAVVMDILMGYFGPVLFFSYTFVKHLREIDIDNLLCNYVGNLLSDYVGKMGQIE